MKNSILQAAVVPLLALAASAPAADVTLPKGTSIEVRVLTPFDSDRVAKGNTFQAAVIRPLYVGGRLAIPRDAQVGGEIKHVRSQRHGAKSGAIAVKFETLTVGGKTHDIEGVLTSFQADERKKILEQEAKLTTGRKVDVVLIGAGTETNRKASALVGTSGENREDLADEWAASGLGPPLVAVTAGTILAMRLDNALTLEAAAGNRAAGDRNILVSADDVRRAQQALKARGLYAGEASGVLDEPTRRAIAGFQIDRGQPATGDLDEVTAHDLGAIPKPR
jgi:putative peptidoglycan binding protein